MQLRRACRGPAWPAVVALLIGLIAAPAIAQDRAGDATTQLEAIEVTGTRIRKAEVEGRTPVLNISREELEASGVASIGDILQRLSVGSSSLNTKFNSAGNFGFPPDSGGVGSGSTTVSLRNLGSKRVLVLVDGLRWVGESSASGVSHSVDLNTIPLSAVDHIELLTDGASSLYGSDAIAGVVNIITRRKMDGPGVRVYLGDYGVGDGATQSGNIALGGSGDRFDFIMDLSYYDQKRINSSDFGQASNEPVPGTGVSLGSSAIPTTRSVFVSPGNNIQGGLCPLQDTDDDGTPDTAICNITANGTSAGPDFTPAFPGEFHRFNGGATGDRFNFAPFNLLLTPSQRTGLFSQVRYRLSDHMDAWVRGLYMARESVNQAAPEPIFIGPGAGTGGLADTVGVDVTNPFNPFGFSLDPAGNFIFAGRRPLEGGPRVFTQNVQTHYLAGGLRGDFPVWKGRVFFWDVNFIDSRNRAQQTVTGTYNIAHIQRALGPVANCTAPCVPLNFFGGPGTITPAMLNYIQFIENDRSVQGLDSWTANLTGPLFDMPAGTFDFAAGFEHRRLSGSYSPDSVVTSGETNGVPSLPTSGAYDVDEAYLELRIPLLANMPGAEQLELSLAERRSDYSSFGVTNNGKVGLRWAPLKQLTTRLTWAEGFRAPSVGELFGSPSRFDATLEDPCSGATNPTIIANCGTLGVPGGFTQANTQISVRTGGNAALQPETSESLTVGAVWSPPWAENQAWSNRLDFEITYYNHKLEDAIQPIDAQTQLDRCVATLDPAFCAGISRGTTGDINGFDNTLKNLGDIDTEGYDFGLDWIGPRLGWGGLGLNWQTTYVDKFVSRSKATGLAEPRTVGVETSDSAIPRVRSNLRLKYGIAGLEVGWGLRYISKLTEQCGDAVGFPSCSNSAAGTNELDSVVYNDVRVGYALPGKLRAKLAAGINNLFDKDPPVCVSCSLNGYDASTYDLPGQFGYLEASIGF